MKIERKSGILLHITSLPGPYGIGTLGRNAFNFVDFLVKAKQKIWQILPLGPTGYGDSPYQSFSTFAGNPLLIDFEKLVEKGWLNASELDNAPGNDNYVDFGPVINSNSKHYRKLLEDLKNWLHPMRIWSLAIFVLRINPGSTIMPSLWN